MQVYRTEKGVVRRQYVKLKQHICIRSDLRWWWYACGAVMMMIIMATTDDDYDDEDDNGDDDG